MRLFFTSLLITLVLSLAAGELKAQDNDFQIANRLMQQDRYEEALPILQELHEDNPGAFIFFDRYIECLINLKEFETAEEITRRKLDRGEDNQQTRIKLAEVLHISGNREEARKIWAETVAGNDNRMQTYYNVGSSMTNRREYDAAIDLYKSAREKFGDPSMFLNELANIYMQAGRFEESVNEFYKLIIDSPGQMGLVQQQFLRMRDQELYEVAAFELEDLLMDLNTDNAAYSSLYQLLTWLFLETGEYDRAYIFARQYENQTDITVYSLYSLGNQLLSAGRFDLAIEAYSYYLENESGSIKYRSMEDAARAYVQWSQHLQHHNLETPDRHQELYLKAYDLNQKLIEQAPGFDRIDRVFSSLIDMAVDHFKDPEKALHWYEKMKGSVSGSDNAYQYYAEGRIALFNRNFTTVRQALTRADRTTENSGLSEKARYYLSLSDLYSGDYEFAGIQLRSLERRHTSFYANDAIKLRMWIKNGQRADTTGSVLKTIGNSLYSIHTGKYQEALEELEPILADAQNPFSDDLTTELSKVLPESYNTLVIKLLEYHIARHSYSPLRERMLWDRALIAEQFLLRETAPDTAEPFMFEFLSGQDEPVYTESDLYEMFEEILIEFPDGFYAPHAREKLQTLQQTSYQL